MANKASPAMLRHPWPSEPYRGFSPTHVGIKRDFLSKSFVFSSGGEGGIPSLLRHPGARDTRPSVAVGTLARVLTHPPEIKKDSLSKSFVITRATNKVAERAGFEPANAFTRYSISNRAPSAVLSHLSTSI